MKLAVLIAFLWITSLLGSLVFGVSMGMRILDRVAWPTVEDRHLAKYFEMLSEQEHAEFRGVATAKDCKITEASDRDKEVGFALNGSCRTRLGDRELYYWAQYSSGGERMIWDSEVRQISTELAPAVDSGAVAKDGP